MGGGGARWKGPSKRDLIGLRSILLSFFSSSNRDKGEGKQRLESSLWLQKTTVERKDLNKTITQLCRVQRLILSLPSD